jgi:SulP family sulfate permease
MTIAIEGRFATLKHDLFGGLTAAVVALPLALAFGVASGAGAIAGLYGAIAVGFFAAVFGGTPSQVSGPTGPMTVVMAVVVTQSAGNLAEAFTIVMFGGLIQIAFGTLRLGRYIAYTPFSVISGFMSGIGVIIMAIQVLPLFGLATAGGPVASVMAWPRLATELNADALIVGVATLAVTVLWPGLFRRFLPSPLAALIIGTLVAIFLFPAAPRLGEIPTGLPSLVIPVLDFGEIPRMLQAGFILAILGSIDSLLTSLIADQITRSRHDSDRELIGQGIGNIAAGLIGGLPGAGATMRTVINVRAGGRTPASGAIHAVVLAAVVLGLAPLAEPIPHAALAGILIKVGWDIVDWRFLKRMHRAPREEAIVMFVTLGLTVFVDLITAVAVGIILASFVTARWVGKEEIKAVERVTGLEEGRLTEKEREAILGTEGKVVLYRFGGSFSYASARELARAVSADPQHEVIILDFTDAVMIDLTAALAIEELIEALQAGGARVLVAGLASAALKVLHKLKALDPVPKEWRFEHRREAVKAALALVRKEAASGTG